jgi:hypothetical protein
MLNCLLRRQYIRRASIPKMRMRAMTMKRKRDMTKEIRREKIRRRRRSKSPKSSWLSMRNMLKRRQRGSSGIKKRSRWLEETRIKIRRS